jgi:hypothetical protein
MSIFSWNSILFIIFLWITLIIRVHYIVCIPTTWLGFFNSELSSLAYHTHIRGHSPLCQHLQLASVPLGLVKQPSLGDERTPPSRGLASFTLLITLFSTVAGRAEEYMILITIPAYEIGPSVIRGGCWCLFELQSSDSKLWVEEISILFYSFIPCDVCSLLRSDSVLMWLAIDDRRIRC